MSRLAATESWDLGHWKNAVSGPETGTSARGKGSLLLFPSHQAVVTVTLPTEPPSLPANGLSHRINSFSATPAMHTALGIVPSPVCIAIGWYPTTPSARAFCFLLRPPEVLKFLFYRFPLSSLSWSKLFPSSRITPSLVPTSQNVSHERLPCEPIIAQSSIYNIMAHVTPALSASLKPPASSTTLQNTTLTTVEECDTAIVTVPYTASIDTMVLGRLHCCIRR